MYQTLRSVQASGDTQMNSCRGTTAAVSIELAGTDLLHNNYYGGRRQIQMIN